MSQWFPWTVFNAVPRSLSLRQILLTYLLSDFRSHRLALLLWCSARYPSVIIKWSSTFPFTIIIFSGRSLSFFSRSFNILVSAWLCRRTNRRKSGGRWRQENAVMMMRKQESCVPLQIQKLQTWLWLWIHWPKKKRVTKRWKMPEEES